MDDDNGDWYRNEFTGAMLLTAQGWDNLQKKEQEREARRREQEDFERRLERDRVNLEKARAWNAAAPERAERRRQRAERENRINGYLWFLFAILFVVTLLVASALLAQVGG